MKRQMLIHKKQSQHSPKTNMLPFSRIIAHSAVLSLMLLLLNHTQQLHAQDQNATQTDLTTATEDYLLKQQRNYLLKLMIYSNDPIEKRLTIQRLAQLVDNGQLKQDDLLAVNTLISLAQQGSVQKSYDANGNLINDDFPVRTAACNLLGKLGGPLAKAGLISIMQSDSEPIVVATAMENILKVDPKGNPTILRNIVNTFYQYHYGNRDNSLAKTFVYIAAEYAAASRGKLLSQELLQAIHDISLRSNVYQAATRIHARSLILQWIGGNYPSFQELN